VSTKLSTRGIGKRYGPTVALLPTDIDVRQGELLTLLGPSGAGKTTLLQIIAGLVEPTEGQLLIKNLREHMQLEIRKLHRDLGATFIYGMKWMRSMVKIANGGRSVLPAGA